MKSVEVKLIDTIEESNLDDLGNEIAEITIDSLMDEGFLQKLPIVGIVAGIVKVSSSVRDKLLAKKILLFLRSLKSINGSKRENFTNELNKDGRSRQRVGEQLILILDHLNDMAKPEIIGNLFLAYLNENINYNQFIRISNIVNRSELSDFDFLYSLRPNIDYAPEDIKQRMVNNGLMSIKTERNERLTYITRNENDLAYDIKFKKNDDYDLLLKYGFNR